MNQLLSNLEFGDPSRLRTVEPHWFELYRDLHAHPELSGDETRTAAIVAEELRRIGGWDVTVGVGGTGVVGVLEGSSGPVVLLRADMDALPVAEDTGLSYASRTDGVMHACGHDVHATALLATCAALSADPTSITGTVVAVFQPAEETGSGARAMVDDGIFDRFPRPDLCLGQHVGPTPAGMLVSKPDILMAASDTIRVVFHGRGGHASSPYACIDPLLMAASFALRIQSLVAHEAATPTAPVLTVGALHAGTAANIIADDAELLLSLRTFSASSRDHMLESVGRIARAEADGAGAVEQPDVHAYNSFPATVNTPDATSTVMSDLRQAGLGMHTLSQPLSGSEDFGIFGTAGQCPSVFWHFGGTALQSFDGTALAALAEGRIPPGTPSNHSPRFAPDPAAALPEGVTAMTAAALGALARSA